MGLRLEVLQPREGFFLRIWNGNKFINQQTNQCTVNSFTATEITGDKTYTYLLLQHIGNLRIPRGDYFFLPGFFRNPDFSVRRGLREALRYGVALGMGWTDHEAEEYLANHHEATLRFRTPLIVKPNSLSGGKGVSRVDAFLELEPAINKVFDLLTDIEYIAIIQEYIAGKEYRLLLLDDELQLCYEKKYLSVVGDGKKTIEELVHDKNQQLRSRGERIDPIDPHNPILRKVLKREDFQLDSVLKAGGELVLNDVTSNLEAGAEALDVTEKVKQDYVEMARLIAKEMHLRYLGIDFRCPNIMGPASDAVILEVNGNPGLTHYFLQGNKEKVFEIYEKLFRIMLG